MADRVHPRTETTPLSRPQSPPPRDFSEKPVPRPGTYVIQIPKDQVYRVPPPENATRYQSYTRRQRQSRRSSCRCCFCWLFGLLATLIFLAAASAVVFYLVVRPESPHYAVQGISFKGFNITAASPSSAISPDIQVSVRSENPNRKIGIYYARDSSVKLFFSDIKLCDGVLPAFYQPSENVTEFQTALTGSGIKLTSGVQQGLGNAQKQGKVPLDLVIRAPVRIKLGSFKTWTITVRVDCHLTVDKLTADAIIVSKDCDYSVHPW